MVHIIQQLKVATIIIITMVMVVILNADNNRDMIAQMLKMKYLHVTQ